MQVWFIVAAMWVMKPEPGNPIPIWAMQHPIFPSKQTCEIFRIRNYFDIQLMALQDFSDQSPRRVVKIWCYKLPRAT